MSDKIRVGVMGCASIARRSLAPAFLAHPAFELSAVASRAPDKASDFISGLDIHPPIPTPFACTYDELVSSSADLIYCPLPTGLHYEWVKKCLAVGKHVLCEKSLACSLAETQDLVQTAREHHCFLMESFQFRFHAQNLYVKELLARRTIGSLRQLVVRFGIPPFPDGAKNIRYSAELGGGAILDNGAYTIKCTTYLLGKDGIEVLAAMKGGSKADLGNVELTGSIMLRAGDIPVQTAYGFDHFYQNGYEIWGTEGKISTTRAFTAREDFAAPVILETKAGREVKTFNDDHFARLLDYVARSLIDKDYEKEYNECLVQSKLLESVKRKTV